MGIRGVISSRAPFVSPSCVCMPSPMSLVCPVCVTRYSYVPRRRLAAQAEVVGPETAHAPPDVRWRRATTFGARASETTAEVASRWVGGLLAHPPTPLPV